MTAEINDLQEARAKLTEEPERKAAEEPAAAEKAAKATPEPKEAQERAAPTLVKELFRLVPGGTNVKDPMLELRCAVKRACTSRKGY